MGVKDDDSGERREVVKALAALPVLHSAFRSSSPPTLPYPPCCQCAVCCSHRRRAVAARWHWHPSALRHQQSRHQQRCCPGSSRGGRPSPACLQEGMPAADWLHHRVLPSKERKRRARRRTRGRASGERKRVQEAAGNHCPVKRSATANAPTGADGRTQPVGKEEQQNKEAGRQSVLQDQEPPATPRKTSKHCSLNGSILLRTMLLWPPTEAAEGASGRLAAQLSMSPRSRASSSVFFCSRRR